MGSELQKIGKRRIKFLAVLLSLSIILSSFLIQRAYGTITTEYEQSEFDAFGRVLFRFKLKVVIETEPDGTWIRNKLYRVDFIISLNFVNESRVKYGEVIFYDPGLINLHSPIGRIPNNISLRHYEGAFRFKNSYEYATRLDTYPSIHFNFTEIRPKGEFLSWGEYFHSDSYCGNEPIYIDVKEPSSESLQPLSLIMGVIIGVGSTLLGIKIGEKRAEKKKANP
jgi:hypothetical protein